MLKYSDLIGIPFVDGGRTIEEGLDCWGLARILFSRQGIKLPEYPIGASLHDSVTNEFKKQEPLWDRLDRPVEGCLVLIRIWDTGWANHCGIYIGQGQFIHAYGNGVVIDRINRWGPRIIGYYRPKEGKYND
jgi:cell wall-associated NlpC family hydrolase